MTAKPFITRNIGRIPMGIALGLSRSKDTTAHAFLMLVAACGFRNGANSVALHLARSAVFVEN
jgi:hypothetical protein